MRSSRLMLTWLALLFVAMSPVFAEGTWQVQQAPLMTRWAQDVSPEQPHPEYPRPHLVRQSWLNLNGLWDYAVRPLGVPAPESYDGQILVPYPVESALSGVMQRVDGKEIWYRRTFNIPSEWQGRWVLLHLEAVDWEATLWVNDRQVGSHRGGYDPFTFDITEALGEQDAQELVVRVWDPSDQGTQPHGKQVMNPEGIWYTPSTGIWQTVWLEPVPEVRIDALQVMPDVDAGVLRLSVSGIDNSTAYSLRAVAYDQGTPIAETRGSVDSVLELPIDNPKLWSPDSPFLYDLTVQLLENSEVIDEVGSYVGMRKIALGTDEGGDVRLMLNGRPLFQYGTLDQGFWPDGLYTAPTDEALRYDLEVTKELGFNMVRKHVKVESARWYYWADKLGLLVWQDMPNGDRHVGPGEGEIERSEASAEGFELELRRIINARRHHPSIIMWVIFNEGWGQYDSVRLTDWLKGYDPTRLVNTASGWNDLGVGDVHDIHSYPGPDAPPRSSERAAVLGEFGGLGLPVSGHTWQDESNWGYQSFEDAEALMDAYLELVAGVRGLSGTAGLAAAVYTQTTDVESEVNGLMTYDRVFIKMDPARIRDANTQLYLPPPERLALAPTSEEGGHGWRYTTDPPTGDWSAPDFDDSMWSEGPGGFGISGTPGAIVRTEWQSRNLWLRRSFNLELELEALQDLQLRVHHDEDAEIYLNGELIAALPHYTFDYVAINRDGAIRAALRPGENILAVHCKQTWGGQYIDVGLYAYTVPGESN
jgi:hypothetical protein